LPANLRSLPLNSLDTSTSIPGFLVNTNTIAIAIPVSRTLVSVVVGGTNENITNNFSMSSVQIQDANNVWQSYKLYTNTTATPLNATLNTITIS
jgi:hypothetical protein